MLHIKFQDRSREDFFIVFFTIMGMVAILGHVT